MVGTSLLTERNPFPLIVYQGTKREKIVRYVEELDLKREMSKFRLDIIKGYIKNKQPFFMYVDKGCSKLKYKIITI